MRVIGAILLACISEACGNLNVWPLHHGIQDNTTLDVVGKPGLQASTFGLQAVRGRLNAFLSHFSTPKVGLQKLRQELKPSMSYSIPPWDIDSPAAAVAIDISQATKKIGDKAFLKAPKSISEAAEKATDWPMLNLYDQPLESCSNGQGDYFCTYDSKSPVVCLAEYKNDKATDSTMSWSNADAFQCVSIWDSALKMASDSIDQDLVVKCNALPSEIFHSDFSLDKLRSCELEVSVEQMKKCKEFSSAMEQICRSCNSQANSLSAKYTLQSKCEEFGVTPALTSAELYTQPSPENSSIAAVAVFAFVVIQFGLVCMRFVGSGVSFAMPSIRHRTSASAGEPLL